MLTRINILDNIKLIFKNSGRLFENSSLWALAILKFFLETPFEACTIKIFNVEMIDTNFKLHRNTDNSHTLVDAMHKIIMLD